MLHVKEWTVDIGYKKQERTEVGDSKRCREQIHSEMYCRNCNCNKAFPGTKGDFEVFAAIQ